MIKRSRYWALNSAGKKVVRLFTKDPGPPWQIGTGPRLQHITEKMSAVARQTHTGVPKSPEQKEKMRQAKLGIPKSETHRAALIASHRARTQRVKELQKQYPRLTWAELQKLEKQLRKAVENETM